MPSRRRSTSSDDAPYHSIPDAPSSTDHILPHAIPETELDVEDVEDVETEPASTHPVDPRIQWIHFLLGCAVLLPWNVMITATPYFLSRLEGSPIRNTFSSYLSTSFTFSNFAFLAHATATSTKAKAAPRTHITILTLSFLSLLLTLSTFTHLPTPLFVAFILLNGICQAAAGSYLQTAIVAVASLFGPATMQAVMGGQAAVAVAVSTVQVLSAGASLHALPPPPPGGHPIPGSPADGPGSDGEGGVDLLVRAVRAAAGGIQTWAESDGKAEEKSARTFFFLSTVFLLLCAVANAWLTRMPEYKAVVAPVDELGSGWAHGRRLSTDLTEQNPLFSPSSRDSGGVVGERIMKKEGWKRIWSVAKRNAIYEVAVAYVFVVTLSVFPPLTISVQPTNPNTAPLLFASIHFLVFSAGDLLGRQLCAYPRLLIWSSRKLAVISSLRTLFIPLFLACNIQRPSPSSSSLLSRAPLDPLDPSSTPLITSDALFMFLLLLFGTSNGYVSSMCMMSAPSVEHNKRLKGRKEEVDIAATVTSFCLVGGLVLGSVMSFGVRAAVCRCNPFSV